MRRRASEEKVRDGIRRFLRDLLGVADPPDVTLWYDGGSWAFYIRANDSTSWRKAGGLFEWYGTSWRPGDPLSEDDGAEDDDYRDAP